MHEKKSYPKNPITPSYGNTSYPPNDGFLQGFIHPRWVFGISSINSMIFFEASPKNPSNDSGIPKLQNSLLGGFLLGMVGSKGMLENSYIDL